MHCCCIDEEYRGLFGALLDRCEGEEKGLRERGERWVRNGSYIWMKFVGVLEDLLFGARKT